MRFRRQLQPDGPTVAVRYDGAWVPLRTAATATGQDAVAALGADPADLVALLAGGAATRERIVALCQAAEGLVLPTGAVTLPFEPRLLRCFAQYRAHWEPAALALAGRYHPMRAVVRPFLRSYQALTRRPFPALRPGAEFDEHPVNYTGNHLTVQPDGATVAWPSYCTDLDYELEFGVVVVKPLLDADPATALDAVGGFVAFNDLSARDTQWSEHQHGLFGPVVKTKCFASALGAEVVTPDEVLPWLDGLTATVSVNGEVWATTSTAGMRHPLGAMVAWASRGEQVVPGELLTSGTLPGGSGMEIDRWIGPGDVVTVAIERIGSVTSVIGPRPTGAVAR